MKKTVTVNLNGRIFNIDEDAYSLLDNYIRNLRIHFRKEKDHSEIISDFEARIEELFSEKLSRGYDVITLEDVENVINRMGKPEDFSETPPEEKTVPEEEAEVSAPKTEKKFFRDVDNKILGGVCSGIAAYFNWDALIVRIMWVVLTILIPGFWFLIAYFILFLLVPPAITASQKLQMRGEPVTVENIGRKVAESQVSGHRQSDGCLGFMLKFFLIGFLCIIGFPLFFGLFITLVVLIAVIFGLGGAMAWIPLQMFGYDLSSLTETQNILGIVSLILLIGIPLVLLVYALFANYGKVKPMSGKAKWLNVIIWFIALAIFLTSGIQIAKKKGFFERNKINLGWNTDKTGNLKTLGKSGVTTEETLLLEPFESLRTHRDFIAKIILKKENISVPEMHVKGDENLIENLSWKVEKDILRLSFGDGYNLKNLSVNDLVITLKVPDLKGIDIRSLANVKLENKFDPDNFFIEVNGAGQVEADSLYCESLKANLEGVGNLELKGKSRNVRLNLKGAGNINAFNLQADTIRADLKGLGKINCDPVDLLDARVDGVGRISYKNEPQSKNVTIKGIGKVKKK